MNLLSLNIYPELYSIISMVSTNVHYRGYEMKEHIYLKLAKDIESKINSGEYKIREKLPSERELAKAYGVSRMTARQAITSLLEEGVVFRERGSGTFVQAPSIQQNNVKSFTETVEALGFKVKNRIIEFSTVSSLKTIAKVLELPDDTSFYKLKRLRLGNSIPMALEVLYIPKVYLPGLDTFDMDQSLYYLLEEEYGINVSRVSYQVEAILANPVHMKIMELKKVTALLKVTGISYDQDGRKLLYEESLYRSDLYTYHMDVSKKY